MIDKSLDRFLMVFFGISGIAILMLVWLRPTPGSERILATFIGSIGLFVGLFRVIQRKENNGD